MNVADNVGNQLRKVAFKKILDQEMAWFEKKKPGALYAELMQSTQRVRHVLNIHLLHSVRATCTAISGIYIAFSLNQNVAQIVFVFFLCYGLATFWLDRLRLHNRDHRVKTRASGKLFNQALSSIRTVQANNAQEFEKRRYAQALEDTGILDRKSLIMGSTISCLYFVLTHISHCFNTWMAAGYFYAGVTSATTVLAIGMAADSAADAVGDMMRVFFEFQKELDVAQPLFDILALENEEDEDTSGASDSEITERISFNDVHFTYPMRPEVEVLKGLTFDCDPGQTIAVVGSSGSGKSTILQLILRLYRPNSGEIRLSDIPIEKYSRKNLRHIISVVGQEPVLFRASILENIRYGKEDATDAEVMMALQKANALDFVRRLPNGWNTKVGERGCQLSGGQKQRIAIARALIKNPRILILDEATSALDSQSEAEVMKNALKKASPQPDSPRFGPGWSQTEP
ncbi:unnamed protein product, partial [Mesorhabditis spiculigera]